MIVNKTRRDNRVIRKYGGNRTQASLTKCLMVNQIKSIVSKRRNTLVDNNRKLTDSAQKLDQKLLQAINVARNNDRNTSL